MNDPKYPVGPAFDHAREAQNAWRQQQIATLTQEQTLEYDRRVQDERKKLEAEKRRSESQKPQRIEAEKQRLLSGKPAPELRMLQGEAIKHKKAEELAKSTVEQNANTQVERAGKEARERLDGYLRQAERERGEHKQQEQTARRDFNEKAQNQEKNRADDPLARAFQKAERQQQQSQQHERAQAQTAQEQERNRERGRN